MVRLPYNLTLGFAVDVTTCLKIHLQCTYTSAFLSKRISYHFYLRSNYIIKFTLKGNVQRFNTYTIAGLYLVRIIN